MGDGHSFYPDLALLAEVYDGVTANEQTQWAEEKVAEEFSTWGCSQYEDYLDAAREWEESEMHDLEKERLSKLISRIHELLMPYLDKDIWEDFWDEGETKNVRDIYSLNLGYDWDDTHFLASMDLYLKNHGDFGPPNNGNYRYDTIGGELVGKLSEYMEYDDFIKALEQVLKAIDKYLLNPNKGILHENS